MHLEPRPEPCTPHGAHRTLGSGVRRMEEFVDMQHSPSGDKPLAPWACAALQPRVEEAGAISGEPRVRNSGSVIRTRIHSGSSWAPSDL